MGQRIVELQMADGSWGQFHSHSKPTKENPITTEYALKRLHVLGLTKDDAPIKKALSYLIDCLSGKRQIPDRREKVLNWDEFEKHMLATWIRLFEPDNPLALKTAKKWAEIVTPSFQSGAFDEEIYAIEYRKRIPRLHKNERLIGLSQFYTVNLLQGLLDEKIEKHYVDFVVNFPTGIYYVNNHRIADLPQVFGGKETSRFVAALEQLAGFGSAKDKLIFAVDWLYCNQNQNGEWDFGASAKDNIYFPLANSWRKDTDRYSDSTKRIQKLLKRLE